MNTPHSIERRDRFLTWTGILVNFELDSKSILDLSSWEACFILILIYAYYIFKWIIQDECALLPEVGAILPSSRTRSSVAKNHYTKLSRGNFASGETDPESDEDVRRMAADLASSRRH